VENNAGGREYPVVSLTSMSFEKCLLAAQGYLELEMPVEAIAELEKEYGWKSYSQKHFESRFTKFYEGYWLPTRFGYDVRKVQFSSLILTNQMTRDEALEKLKTPSYDLEKIDEDFKYIAIKLGISVDELNKYLKMKKYFYWNYKNSENLFKLGASFLNLIGVEKTKKRKK
jgi:hypothetical protein